MWCTNESKTAQSSLKTEQSSLKPKSSEGPVGTEPRGRRTTKGEITVDHQMWEMDTERLPFTADDALWAAQTFGEAENDEEIAEFEEWLDGLNGREFWQATNAIDALRGVMKAYNARINLSRVLAHVRRDA